MEIEMATAGQTATDLTERLKRICAAMQNSAHSTHSPASEPQPDNSCPTCGGTGFVRIDVPVGHPDFGKAVPCPDAMHTAERAARLAEISHLLPAELSIRLADITPTAGNRAMLAACRAMIDTPRGWLYIHGGPGNAKSVALMAIVNEVNAAGRGPAMYIKFTDLLNWMRDAYRENTLRDKTPETMLGYVERFARVKSIRVLAIDEFDKARSTSFADEFRFDFLDERYRTGVAGETATIFASNTPPSVLPEPIYDRIRDGRFVIVENTETSARPYMTRNE